MGYKPLEKENSDNLLMLFALLITIAMVFAFLCGFFWTYTNLPQINPAAAKLVQAYPVAAPAAALTCICMAPATFFMLFALYHRRTDRTEFEILADPDNLS